MIEGYTTRKVTDYLNRLVGREKGWRHLEVGAHKGATFIFSMLHNYDAFGVTYENYSEFDSSGEVQEALHKNLEEYSKEMGKFELREEDFFNAEVEKEYFDSFFYDGDHSEGSHYLSVIRAWEVCKPHFVFLVDDWDWPAVQEGTWRGLRAFGGWSCTFKELRSDEGYHNGVAVFEIDR